MSTFSGKFHREAEEMLAYLDEHDVDSYAEKNLDEVRKNNFLTSPTLNGSVAFDGKCNELVIPSPDVDDGIPVTVYVPTSGQVDPSIWVYFHGGGFVIGTRESCETACKTISMGAGVIVVNVEYRLAPEFKFPAQVDDAVCVLKWVLANKTAVGGSQRSLVGVGGDSAGGTISASVCHDVPGIDFQILIYPRLVRGQEFNLESWSTYKDGPLLTPTFSKWLVGHYLPPGMEHSPRLVSIMRENFSNLPRALIVVAEIDLLRDESYVYQRKLNEVGVSCELFEVKGVIHAFFTMPGMFKTTTQLAYNKVINFLNELKM